MAKAATQIRLEETTFDKAKIIAEKELRSLNAQLEYFIQKGIQAYEAEHGTISLSEQ